jgi:hypothetical protein
MPPMTDIEQALAEEISLAETSVSDLPAARPENLAAAPATDTPSNTTADSGWPGELQNYMIMPGSGCVVLGYAAPTALTRC